MNLSDQKLNIPIAIISIVVVIALGIFATKHSTPAMADQTIYNSIPTDAGKANFTKQSTNLTKPVDPELVNLDSQIISCAPDVDGVLSATPTTGGSCLAGPTTLTSTTGMYMGGQCCGTLMDTTEYHQNLQKLQAYKNMPATILDPMHTPIPLAKQWIDYDKATTLTPSQQKVFGEAYAVSTEKPCCCKCWHYYVNEGIAKKMIIDGTYTAQQIADYWDASTICGA